MSPTMASSELSAVFDRSQRRAKRPKQRAAITTTVIGARGHQRLATTGVDSVGPLLTRTAGAAGVGLLVTRKACGGDLGPRSATCDGEGRCRAARIPDPG